MSRLRSLLLFFASPPELQVHTLLGLPRDRGAPDFYTGLEQNPLKSLAWGLVHESGQHDNESEDAFLARTQLPTTSPYQVLNEASCFIYLLSRSTHADDYWSQRALEHKTEWRLARRLAALTLAELHWQGEVSAEELSLMVKYFRWNSDA